MPSATQTASNVGVGASKNADNPTRSPGTHLAYVPRDARLMALIVDSMGIQDVQPPVLMMLLEFAHRYLYEVLQDSLVYADHANTAKTSNAGVSTLSLDDIQLAIQSRVNHSFTGPPTKEMLLSLASTLNSVPLPPIIDRYGPKLPPPQHCLTNVNFSLIPNPPPSDSSEEDAPGEDEDEEDNGNDGRTGKTELADDAEGSDLGLGEDSEANADTAMDMDASVAGSDTQETQQRGTKRSLDEDEDYD